MKKYILFIFTIMMVSDFHAHAQNGWLPPVTFPSGSQLCDNSPWQLVFYDGFDGTTLSDNWHTYLNWDGQETDNWNQARDCYENALFKDENVLVSNGTCKILIKNESYSWKCASCSPSETRSRNLTAGTICSYFHTNGQPSFYNSGKFEARIKFPLQAGTWCAFWVNHGAHVNEIDIAEAYGSTPAINKPPVATYNLHAWAPNNNPYNLPNDAAIENTYPNQNWWNIFFPIFGFNQADWHTYTCYWDTAKLEFYVDGGHVNTIWKYYQYRYISGPRRHAVNDPVYRYKVYPTCSPVSGVWQVTYGYPYSNSSESIIRLNTSMIPSYTGNPNAGVYEIGRMEVDYVKAWQRHPEEDGHENICHLDEEPVVSGPNQLCTNGTFVATPAIPGGYWTTTTGAAITNSGVYGNGNAFAEVSRTANTWSQASGGITYNYPTGPEGCPTNHAVKIFNCFSLPGHQFMEVNSQMGNYGQFLLFAPRDELAPDLQPTFEWNLTYVAGKTTDTQHYQATGRFISTPIYELSPDNQIFYLHWQVTAKGADGQVITRSGSRTEQTRYGQQTEDTNVYYLDARITNPDAYEQSVYQAVAQTFMAPDADSGEVLQMIEKVRTQKLAPYIVPLETTQNRPGNSNISNWEDYRLAKLNKKENQDTRIYPNPTAKTLSIQPGHNFVDTNGPVTVKICDMVGRLIKIVKKSYIAGEPLSLSLSELNPGNYFVEIRQKSYSEHYQIIKRPK